MMKPLQTYKVWNVVKVFHGCKTVRNFARYCLRNVMRFKSGKHLQKFSCKTSAKETSIIPGL